MEDNGLEYLQYLIVWNEYPIKQVVLDFCVSTKTTISTQSGGRDPRDERQVIMSRHVPGWCPTCQTQVMAIQDQPNHILHAILTIFLCGFWLPVWLMIMMMGSGSPTCTRCGSPCG